jgi:hypothetical protein
VVRHKLLLSLVVAVLVQVPVVAGSGDCTQIVDVTGCNNGDHVEVGGTENTPGSGGGTGTNNGGTGGDDIVWKCMEATCDGDDDYDVIRPITLSDIASFRPHPGVQHMQPDGWTVPGLQTNFYAVTGVHIVHGTLLGDAAAVRFTPVAFHWAYGDGKSATRSTKGGTWHALGVHEFDKTPTSHVYRRDGTYTIRLTIDFAAEYQFAGSPFYPIPGVLPLAANDLHITVDGAKTVLVEHDCAANPNGPGC